jgi:hypothetical protein
MIRLGFRLPVVMSEPPQRQGSCPYCRGHLIRHHTTLRGLTDLRVSAVTVQRYRCAGCGLPLKLTPFLVDNRSRHR